MPIQQMLLGVGAKDKTYLDDVFSSYLWEGNASARSINNGINLSESGGMVWVKNREIAFNHTLQDTERGTGATKKICSNLSNGQNDGADTGATWAGYISAFNNNGFSLDKSGSNGSYDWANFNRDDEDYTSWTFRKAPGFFDVVTWTGNGSNRTIAHSLGSVPGMIMVKCTSESRDWAVYHRDLKGKTGDEENAGTAIIFLNTTEGRSHNDEYWNDTEPTSTHFSVGVQNGTNKNGATYVAYLFAGGESTATTARSVDFDASGDYLTIPDSADWTLGNTFTIEFWVYLNSGAIAANGHDAIVTQGNSGNSNGWWITVRGSDDAGSGNLHFKDQDTSNYQFNSADKSIYEGQWTHCALVCNSGTAQWYVNGTASGASGTINLSTDVGNAFGIGTIYSNTNTYLLDGKISNLRIVKGTAVYTSSFKPPTEPLTNITNTKLLCCNNSSTTGSTVSPGTITAQGDPTASTDSPFDDSAGFTFGDAGDQNVIKCGSYVGAGGWTTVNIGWQPQWVLIKRTDSAQNWFLWDTMRGWFNGSAGDKELYPNLANAEYTYGTNFLEPTSTGFRVDASAGHKFIFVALRNSDGYVGKPAEAGTDVFHMLNGTQTNSPPWFKPTDFDVDFAFTRNTGASDDWPIGSRLTGQSRLYTNLSNAATDNGNFLWDYSGGWNGYTGSESGYQAWMFKRHAGMDVVAYEGDGVAGREMPHSLSKTPEMMWVKNRSTNSRSWAVYHKDLGGSDPAYAF